jgi:type I restriction enzyme S subunit
MSIAHAPNGITRLREMILQLAVQGKLVPQDANDEPASVLLTKIQAEKERLIQAGTIKRPKPLPAIKDEEKPFALPKGWEWVRLGEVTNYGYTEKAEFDDVEENTWVLELEDVEKISSRLIEKGHDLKALKKRLSIQVPITLS